jgi:DNA primase
MLDVAELKSRVDLRDILGHENLHCPWHEDGFTPNLHVYQDHVHCFACGKTSDGLGYLMKAEGLTFPQALERLEDYEREAPVPAPERLTEPMDEKIAVYYQKKLGVFQLPWLSNRGLQLPIIQKLQIGWTGTAYSIPHYVEGELENIKYRNVSGEGPKYYAERGRGFTHLFPFDYFYKYSLFSPLLYLCEGELDAMLLLQAGLPAMSVPTGANTDLSKYHPFLSRFQLIVLCYDMDEAGDKAAEKLRHSPLPIRRKTWNRQYKDVTDARAFLIPELKRDYGILLRQLSEGWRERGTGC